MNKIKHSKFKNTGILFELLVRQVTADILENTQDSKANKILQRFFNEETELGKELKLYQLLVHEKAKDSIGADRIVEMICKSRRKISSKKLNEQKYNLIKTIKEHYPLDSFLRGKISNYKLFASVYKLFEDASSTDTNYDPSDVLSSRNFITEGLLGNVTSNKTDADKDKLLEFYKKQEEDLRLLSYKILVDNFNKKYSKLDDRQKTLLKEYINNVSNTNSLKHYIETEVPAVKSELKLFEEKIADKVVKIKISEVCNQLDKAVKGKTVKDSQVTSLLLSYELIKELKNVTTDA
jgi:mRNA-degrading endonuclease RelE of RelBE toxin-antitoxin system